jgi:hypothetical protein
VAHRGDNNRFLILIEDHPPVADAKTHAIVSFETLNIAMPAFGKLDQPLIDPTADIR